MYNLKMRGGVHIKKFITLSTILSRAPFTGLFAILGRWNYSYWKIIFALLKLNNKSILPKNDGNGTVDRVEPGSRGRWIEYFCNRVDGISRIGILDLVTTLFC